NNLSPVMLKESEFMSGKRFMTWLLMLFMLALLVPSVQAQSRDFDIQDVIRQLGPSNTMPDLLFDILRYAVFIMGFITLMLVPEKQLMPSLLMTGVIGM